MPSWNCRHMKVTILLISVSTVHLQQIVLLALLLRQRGINIPLRELLLLARHPHGVHFGDVPCCLGHLRSLQFARGWTCPAWPLPGAASYASAFLVALGLVRFWSVLDFVSGRRPVHDVLLLDRVLLLIRQVQLLAVPDLDSSSLPVIQIL
jgi:hypothetical protein